MVVVELYALVVEVFSLGSGVYFSPPELYKEAGRVSRLQLEAWPTKSAGGATYGLRFVSYSCHRLWEDHCLHWILYTLQTRSGSSDNHCQSSQGNRKWPGGRPMETGFELSSFRGCWRHQYRRKPS